nr:zf-HC2 domain-containing protein [Variovorax sp. dw_308]
MAVSGRVVHLGGDVHQQVQALLPWYVGQSLDQEERARVETHIAECPRCQAELAWERQLQAECAGIEEVQGNVEHDLAQLRERMARVADPHRQRRDFVARLKDHWRANPAWTRRALAGQFVLIAVLGGALLLSLPPAPQFRALGDAALPSAQDGAGRLIVRFRPDATEQDMRRVLRDSKARLVYGPTATDAWLLSVPADLESAAVKQLREERSVLLVESLDGRAVP